MKWSPDSRHPFHERPGDASKAQAQCALQGCGKNRGAVAHMGTVKVKEA